MGRPSEDVLVYYVRKPAQTIRSEDNAGAESRRMLINEAMRTLLEQETNDIEQLRKVAEEGELSDKLSLAGDSYLPPEIQSVLVNEPDPEVREVLAANDNTVPRVLALLSRDIEGGVRVQVADNPRTEQVTLDELSGDDRTAVRERVASNSNAGQDTLEKLSNDDDPDVSDAALANLRAQGIL